METPHIMHSSLRQPQLSGGNTYSSGNYDSATDATGAFSSPVFPIFAGTGVYLVVVHLSLIESTRTAHSAREPQQINKLNAVLQGSDGTDVVRGGQPYGAWPAEVICKCENHVHTVPAGQSFVGIRGVDTGFTGFALGEGVVGGSRRWQVDQQAFFIVHARRGDRLFVYRDFVPYTALSYEIIRLSPALMRYGAIEI